MMQIPRMLIPLLSAFVFSSAVASGQAPSAPQGRVAISALAAEALRSNPEILAAQKRYEAARQRPSQVSSLPDPMISPGWNSSGAPWPGAGLGMEPVANVGVMITQEIPFPASESSLVTWRRKKPKPSFKAISRPN